MNFLIAARYEFLKNLRDVKMLALLVVFPIVVTYVIGSAVSGYFEPYDGEPIKAAYVILDKGAIGQAFEQFIDSGEVRERVNAARFDSLEEGREALKDGAATVLIHLPEELSESVMRGEGGALVLEGGEGAEFVHALAGSFASSLNANMASLRSGGGPLAAERTASTVRVNRTKGGVYPTLTDYYAVLVLLEALVIGAIFGVYITAKNYGSDIHIRNHALPVRPWTLLFGRMAGSVAYLLMASTATILFTKFAYGVDWSGNPPVMAGTLALFCVIVVGIGMLCGKVFGKPSTSIMVVFVLMFFFGTVSGAVSPRSNAIALGFLSPNYYAKTLLFGTIYGYPAEVMAHSALLLAGFAAAVCLAVLLIARRVNHDNL